MRKLLILAIALVGCVGAPGPTNRPPAAAQPATAQPATSRCQPAAPALVSAISSGLKISGGGSIRNAQAVKSADYESVYFVSADLEGEGLAAKDDVATWASNKSDGTGLIFSVNATAQEFSSWGAQSVGGRVTVDSQTDRGTRIEVSDPLGRGARGRGRSGSGA